MAGRKARLAARMARITEGDFWGMREIQGEEMPAVRLTELVFARASNSIAMHRPTVAASTVHRLVVQFPCRIVQVLVSW